MLVNLNVGFLKEKLVCTMKRHLSSDKTTQDSKYGGSWLILCAVKQSRS